MLELNTPYAMSENEVITIEVWEYAESPRTFFSELSTFVTFEKGCKSPDENEFESIDELKEFLESGDYIWSYVEKTEHSTVNYCTRAHTEMQGAGIVGIIYISESDVRNKYGAYTVTDELREEVYKEFDLELKVYTNWCNNEVYGFIIETMEGEEIDSSYGYYSGIYDMLAVEGIDEKEFKKVKKVTTHHYERG